MATTWDAWDDHVMPEIPGVSPNLVRHHVKLAAIQFCADSWVWIVDQGPIPVSAQQNTYDWEPPAQADPVHVLQCWLDKHPLIPKTRNELSDIFGDYMRALGPARFFIQDFPNQLIMVPTPNSSSIDGITAKLAVHPSLDATGIDDRIFDVFFDEIAIGAKARLMAMSRKPWSDPTQAQVLNEKFEQAIATAKRDVIRSYAGARLRVRGQFF